jgi:uncharacterized protein YndB with AHSA1/START domain
MQPSGCVSTIGRCLFSGGYIGNEDASITLFSRREYSLETIRHRVGIAASPERIFAAVATRDGLQGWWISTITGNPSKGGSSIEFFTGGTTPLVTMNVVDLIPNEKVSWNCVQGPDEWVGTQLTFVITPSDASEETVLVFEHAHWRDPIEFMYHCSTKWAYFLLGMKGWLEGGESVAWPRDMPISSWDSSYRLKA